MKEKIVYLEFLRVTCAVVVVFDHICIAGINIWGDTASTFDKFCYNGVQHWSHFAVPVFLMITGYLLLDDRREIGYKKAVTKYAWRMMTILLTVGTVFAWMEIFFSTKSFALTGLLEAILKTFQGESWKHLWYLYTLIGLYLALPAIKAVFEKLSARSLDVLLLITFFFASVMPTLTSLTGVRIGVAFPMGSIYLFYFMMGRRIGIAEEYKGRKLNLLFVVMCVLSVLPFVCSYHEYYNDVKVLECFTNYSSPLVVALGILLFYTAKCLNISLKQINRGG